MIYTIQKRHEFGGSTMTTHYEVMSYTHRTPLGILAGAKMLKKGTKKQCEKYCRTKGIVLESLSGRAVQSAAMPRHERALHQHLSQMRKMPPIHPAPLQGLLDYQRRWCPEWVTSRMLADAWGARVQTRQLRRYDR